MIFLINKSGQKDADMKPRRGDSSVEVVVVN